VKEYRLEGVPVPLLWRLGGAGGAG
jgi:hypothetical protein